MEKYGDFIIWKQVLDFAKAKSCPIILVTRDSKDDWWTKKEGKIVSPHLELRREFHEQVQQSFWMYQTQRFYEIANDKLGVELNPRSIEEANAVAEENIAEETVYEKLLEVIQQDQKSSLLESISKLSDLSQARPELLSSLISKSLIDENTLKSIQNLAKNISVEELRGNISKSLIDENTLKSIQNLAKNINVEELRGNISKSLIDENTLKSIQNLAKK